MNTNSSYVKNGGMTWRDVLYALQECTDEQLDTSLTVELLLSEQYFSSTIGDVEFQFSDDDFLNDIKSQPIIIVRA